MTESTHVHLFDPGNQAGERGTRVVLWITLAAMVVEIASGWWFNSMALLADGWHMSSHAVAIGLSTFAYGAARRLAHDPRFAFGTWKIEVLGGFASAVFLMLVAALMAVASIERLINPGEIRYLEAMGVAALGLAVNVVCALVLAGAHHHDHGHGHDHHQDLNLRSAYVHVLADAATSVLAIIALGGGWLYGWGWLDPLMGIVGALLIAVWAKNLLTDTAQVLLDREMDHPVVEEIREVVEGGSTRITDLHVWRAGRRSYYCILTLVTEDDSLTPARVRERLAEHEEIVHSTIEIERVNPAGR
ncbi:MAG: CDF family Co(II)/Ni(II) efflux transporter DmeF [Pseudomonadota bacterium]|nr:CDF family Co(II)/Ni(II) efflux transporter DmeF [Pseudomonadota bacterium]